MEEEGPLAQQFPGAVKEQTGSADTQLERLSDLQAEEAPTVAVEPIPPDGSERDELIEVFARELEASSDDPAHRAALHYQAAVMAEGQGRDLNVSLFQLQCALELAPTRPAYVRAARRAFRRRHNWFRVLQLLDSERAASSMPSDRARLWRERAEVLHDWLLEPEGARAAYCEALAADPADMTSMHGLAQLLRDVGDNEGLVEILRRAISVSEDRRLRAQRYAEIGATKLIGRGEQMAALESYSAAQVEDPNNEAVRLKLKQLHYQQQNWGSLVEALVTEAEASKGRRRISCYRRAAELARLRLEQPERALSLLSRVYEEDDSDPELLRELGELYRGAGRFEELAEVYSRLLDRVDQGEASYVHFELAGVLELQLGRPDDALEHCRRAVDLEPHDTRAGFMLRRLCARLGQWEELVQLCLQHAAEVEKPGDRAALLAEAAEICERHLDDSERAVSYYQRALAAVSSHGPSVLALESLYQRMGDYKRLLQLMEQQLETAGAQPCGGTFVRMAVLSEMVLGDRERAVGYYERAIETGRIGELFQRNVARLLREGVDSEAFAEDTVDQLLASSAAEDALGWGLVAVRLLEYELQRPDEALRRSEQLVERFPLHWTSVDALARHYERQGQWGALADLWERALAAGAVPQAFVPTLHYHVGALAEQYLEQRDRAQTHYQAALDDRVRSALAARGLERIYRQQENWESLYRLLRERDEAARPHRVLAGLCEDKLGRPAEATQWYRDALIRDPADEASREALLWRLSSQDRADEAVALLAELIDGCDDDGTRIVLRVCQAQLLSTELGLPAKAADTLEGALADSGDDLSILCQIQALRQQAGDHERTIDALEQIAASTDDQRERIAILLDAARRVELYAPQRDPAPLYEAALQHHPNERTVLEALVRIYGARCDYIGLAHVLDLLVPLADSHEERAAVLLLSAYCQEAMGETAAARQLLERAAELPEQWGASFELIRLVRSSNAGQELGDAYRRVGEQSRDRRNAIRLFKRASHAYAHAHSSSEANERALEVLDRLTLLDPFDEATARQQEQLLSSRGDWERLTRAMRARLDAAAHSERPWLLEQRRAMVSLLIRLARKQRDHLHQPAVAIETLKEAQEVDPHCVEALTLQAELYGTLDRWQEAAEAYRRVVAHSSDPVVLSLAHFQLGRIWQDRLAEPHQAIAALQNVLALNPQDSRALRRLTRLFVSSSDWENAAATIERLLELEQDPVARREHYLALADILEQGFGDPQAAAERLEMALEIDPLDERLVERLAQLRERLGDARGAVYCARALPRGTSG
jgi:tetratricopeptide (TPR) repeat protein